MLQDNIEYSFATDIPESDYQIIVDCPFFKDWIAKARKDFAVTHIHVTIGILNDHLRGQFL